MKKAILFDLDGVLLDSMPFHVKAWQEIFSQFDIQIEPGDIYEREGTRTVDLAGKLAKSFHLNFFESIQKAVQETIITTQSFIYGLIELFSFKAKNVEDTVAGPVRIITLVGENTTKSFKTGIGEGFHFFFKIISIISIIIALTNLLPIPALDGGTIVISIFEQVRRKPLKLKSIFRFQVIGFSFIALLIVVALFSDIMYIIKNIFS